MELEKAIRDVFLQLSGSINHLDGNQYNYVCKNLSGNTIGQHVRHIIEMFQCLETGYHTGEVDYEKRKRDRKIETDNVLACELLSEIIQKLGTVNRNLFLLTYYDDKGNEPERIATNYFRELAYNLEHTIHHMALIRVGLREIGDIPVDDSYGVAASTIKYRRQCVR
jgi:hypothetical protein